MSKLQNRIQVLPGLSIEGDGEDVEEIADDVDDCEVEDLEFLRHCNVVIIKCLDRPRHKENVVKSHQREEEIQEMTSPPRIIKHPDFLSCTIFDLRFRLGFGTRVGFRFWLLSCPWAGWKMVWRVTQPISEIHERFKWTQRPRIHFKSREDAQPFSTLNSFILVKRSWSLLENFECQVLDPSCQNVFLCISRKKILVRIFFYSLRSQFPCPLFHGSRRQGWENRGKTTQNLPKVFK